MTRQSAESSKSKFNRASWRGLPPRAANFAEAIGAEQHPELARKPSEISGADGDPAVLPLDPAGTYRVAGAGADDIGLQSGGWTISWQGTGNVNADFPNGTSILDGFVARATAAGGDVALYDPDEDLPELDAVVMVMAEPPYAEGQGDIATLAWQQGRSRDLLKVNEVREQGIPRRCLLAAHCGSMPSSMPRMPCIGWSGPRAPRWLTWDKAPSRALIMNLRARRHAGPIMI